MTQFVVIAINCLIWLAWNASLTYAQTTHLAHGKRIGIISAFPPNGMFFQNRATFCDNEKSWHSIFPEKGLQLPGSINQQLIQHVVQSLNRHQGRSEFVELPPLKPEKYLSGYAIEGWWGPETNSVDLKGLSEFFKHKQLNYILAIVPVTYFLPPTQVEATGINLVLSQDQLFFSATYAVLLIAKTKRSYVKVWSSYKQIYLNSVAWSEKPSLKRYRFEHWQAHQDLFKHQFLPHLSEQLIQFVKMPFDSNQSMERYEHIFIKPKKPHRFYSKFD